MNKKRMQHYSETGFQSLKIGSLSSSLLVPTEHLTHTRLTKYVLNWILKKPDQKMKKRIFGLRCRKFVQILMSYLTEKTMQNI